MCNVLNHWRLVGRGVWLDMRVTLLLNCSGKIRLIFASNFLRGTVNVSSLQLAIFCFCNAIRARSSAIVILRLFYYKVVAVFRNF